MINYGFHPTLKYYEVIIGNQWSAEILRTVRRKRVRWITGKVKMMAHGQLVNYLSSSVQFLPFYIDT
jgi:hypothetical protein